MAGIHRAPAQVISSPSGGDAAWPSVAAHGKDVDVLFEQGAGCAPGAPSTTACPLVLAHSDDRGATFSDLVRVAASVHGPSAVATDGSDVLVAWIDETAARVRVRVSADHGMTFRPAKVLGCRPDLPTRSAWQSPTARSTWCTTRM